MGGTGDRRWWMALAGALLFAACGGGGAANSNTPRTNTVTPKPACGPKFVRVELENLDSRDPPYLWPPNNARLAGEPFWGIWKTHDHSPSQMLLSADGKLWHAFGDSTASVHDRQVELARFNSRVMFCVEFEENGKRYRSRVRSAEFGKGAHFKDREVRMVVEPKPDQRHEIELVGANPLAIDGGDYQFAQVPEGMYIGCAPRLGEDNGGKVVLVVDGRTVPQGGAACYLQVADRRTDTLDRIKIVIEAR